MQGAPGRRKDITHDRARERPKRLGPRSRLVAAACVAAFGLLLYLPTVRYPFIWDDPLLTELTASRLKTGGLPALLSSEFVVGSGGVHTGYYRPIVLLSFAADGWLGGGRPGFFHFVNALLHAVVCGLVFLVLSSLLSCDTAALFGALLFAVHPVHVETVAFISGRTDLWAALFLFPATLAWLHASGGERAAPRAAVTIAVLLGAGFLSKETVAMAIPAWLVWDALGIRGAASTPWWRRNRWWVVAGGAGIALALLIRLSYAGVPLGAGSPAASPPTSSWSWVTVFPRLALNLKLLAVPWPLNAYYTTADLNANAALGLGAAAGSALFVLAAWIGRRDGFAASAWALLFLLPVMGFVSLTSSAVAERFLYIPSFGACLAIAIVWQRLQRLQPAAGFAVAGAAVILLAAATVARTAVWSSGVSLFSDMTMKNPNAFVPNYNLGNELMKAGRLDEAEPFLLRAVAIQPARSEAWNNLGTLRVRRGHLEEAEAAYREAVRLSPNYRIAIENLATTQVQLARPADAVKTLESIATPEESQTPILLAAGKTLAASGQRDVAERAFTRAVRAAPSQAKPLQYLGALRIEEGRAAEALPLLEKAVALEDRDAAARFALGVARLAVGDASGARRERDQLRLLDPRLADDLDRRLRAGSGG